MLSIVIRFICMAFVSCTALADGLNDSTSQSNEKTKIWINAGMLSHHFDRTKNFRENNYGFGLEAAFSDVNSAYIGKFRNSDDKESKYFGWVWKPLSLGPVHFGLLAGFFDGYPRANNGNWFPAVIPVASLDNGVVGVNVAVIPKYRDRIYGAVVAQFKLHVW